MSSVAMHAKAAPAAAESFAALFEESLHRQEMKQGEVITAEVVRVDYNFVVVNAGLKSEAYIPIDEFKNDVGAIDVKPGDFVSVAIESLENGYGDTILSRDKAKRLAAWMNLERALEGGEMISGTVTGKVKGGLTVMTNGIRAFLPGSLVDMRPVKDTTPYEGKTLEFKVIKLDRKRNNVVLSRRAVVEASMGEERAKLLETLREGAIVKGTVKNITDYGAFVDLGGVDGRLVIGAPGITRDITINPGTSLAADFLEFQAAESILVSSGSLIHAGGVGGSVGFNTGFATPTGVLTVQSGAEVRARSAFDLNLSELVLDGIFRVEGSTLNLTAGSVFFVPENYAGPTSGGLYLRSGLGSFQGFDTLVLRARSSMTFLGEVDFGPTAALPLADLTLDTPVLAWQPSGGGSAASVRAGNLTLLRSGGTSQAAADGLGQLTLEASGTMAIRQGVLATPGDLVTQGFGNVRLRSGGDLVFQGRGSFTSGSRLDVAYWNHSAAPRSHGYWWPYLSARMKDSTAWPRRPCASYSSSSGRP